MWLYRSCRRQEDETKHQKQKTFTIQVINTIGINHVVASHIFLITSLWLKCEPCESHTRNELALETITIAVSMNQFIFFCIRFFFAMWNILNNAMIDYYWYYCDGFCSARCYKWCSTDRELVYVALVKRVHIRAKKGQPFHHSWK